MANAVMDAIVELGGEVMANEKRLIDANALLEELKEKHDWVMQDPEISHSIKWGEAVCNHRVCEAIENAPTVDAVEVVRCKDCKHYKTITCSCGCNVVSDNWYCADGERRTNG